MAIKMRRGLKADLDTSKLVAGEIAKGDIQNTGKLTVQGTKLKWSNNT